ncbi:DUF4129 domain-containing protein [Dehalococcoidia bacterium]|nr:DUF4129 domain-containing protein [Dehalococcoidia bacterium]
MKGRRRWLAIALVVVFCALPLSALAQEEPPVKHEDPEVAEFAYDPISLLRYYSETQDFLLRKDAEAVAERLGKLPFANVPDDLREPIDELNAHEIKLAGLAVEVAQGLEEMGKLVGEFRLDEALELADGLGGQIAGAYAALDEIEGLVGVIGERTGAAAAPGGSELRRAYDELVDKVDKKREMIDLHKGLLIDLLLGIRPVAGPKHLRVAEEIARQLGVVELPPIKAAEQPRPTEVTLKIGPTTAFVGEEVHFWGRLSAGKKPLAGREIDLLLDGTVYASTVTGEGGWYGGIFLVPYKYVPEVVLEALYRPRDEDVGRYLASKSPPVSLRVLFYSATLTLSLEDRAFPGRGTEVGGGFDYEGYPVPQTRQIEVYLDDSLVARAEVGSHFSLSLQLDPQTELGKRRITVAAPAVGRHAPVIASAYLNVVQATPVVDLNLPWVAFIPGGIELSGRVFSEVGPVSRGEINLKLGRTEAGAITAEDGSFAVKIRKGMGLELIGSQSLRVQVIPREPWHSAEISTESLFVVNWVNSGGILLGLLALGILAQSRARRFALPRRRKDGQSGVQTPDSRLQTPDSRLQTPDFRLSPDALPAGEPGSRIVGWYRRVVRLLLQVFHLVFSPSQTLREFLREVSPRLGPAAGFFEELTRLVERALYSPRKPTEEEAGRGEEISRQVERGVKGV